MWRNSRSNFPWSRGVFEAGFQPCVLLGWETCDVAAGWDNDAPLALFTRLAEGFSVKNYSNFPYEPDGVVLWFAMARGGIRNGFRGVVAMREIFAIEIFSKFRYALKVESV